MSKEKRVFLADLKKHRSLEKIIRNNLRRECARKPKSKNLSFTHKWNRQVTEYNLEDLVLPESVYVIGEYIPRLGKDICVAISGTLSPSYHGFRLAERIACRVASLGFTVVSGGAPGIDTAAHMGALGPEKGSTIAVIPNPVKFGLEKNNYSSRFLTRSILERGCLISENTRYATVAGKTFNERLLERDRIIAGLSDVLIVVESSQNSATVDTAKRAWIQGKIVLAIKWDDRVGLRHEPKMSGNEQLLACNIATPIGRNDLASLDSILGRLKKGIKKGMINDRRIKDRRIKDIGPSG